MLFVLLGEGILGWLLVYKRLPCLGVFIRYECAEFWQTFQIRGGKFPGSSYFVNPRARGRHWGITLQDVSSHPMSFGNQIGL